MPVSCNTESISSLRCLISTSWARIPWSSPSQMVLRLNALGELTRQRTPSLTSEYFVISRIASVLKSKFEATSNPIPRSATSKTRPNENSPFLHSALAKAQESQ